MSAIALNKLLIAPRQSRLGWRLFRHYSLDKTQTKNQRSFGRTASRNKPFSPYNSLLCRARVEMGTVGGFRGICRGPLPPCPPYVCPKKRRKKGTKEKRKEQRNEEGRTFIFGDFSWRNLLKLHVGCFKILKTLRRSPQHSFLPSVWSVWIRLWCGYTLWTRGRWRRRGRICALIAHMLFVTWV